MSELIEVEDVSYRFGETVAVDGISFTVAEGEVLGFLGPNGAGKSTTIKMLIGLLEPQRGSVSLFGQRVSRRTRGLRRRVGICFEEKNLYLELSAVENLVFFARLHGRRGYDPEAALARVGLADRGHERVRGFSKGMRQRLMVARALVNAPDVLILDEPTDGLDPVSSKAIRDIIGEEAHRGAAVLLTTHDMYEADQLSDRVAFINEGRIVAIAPPGDLKQQHGNRSIRVTRRDGNRRVDEHIPLDEADAGEKLAGMIAAGGVLTVHTEEATLEDIFIELTGRRLG